MLHAVAADLYTNFLREFKSGEEERANREKRREREMQKRERTIFCGNTFLVPTF